MGKTTLLRLAAGLEKPRGGCIRPMVSCCQIASMTPPEKRGIGYMFQDYALFPHLTVLQNVTFGLLNQSSESTRRGLDVLEQVGMENVADIYPHELSGGQQQRVALARALAPNPAVILLDEPYAGLIAVFVNGSAEMLHVLKAANAVA